MESSSLCQELVIDENKVIQYVKLTGMTLESIPPEYRITHKLALYALQSKQSNEPYEMLLSDVLGLYNNPLKHGWDAVDNKDEPYEFYEYKPSSKTFFPTGSINDDTIKKIEKCEQLVNQGKQGWLILAGIDKEKCTFNSIYKFPLEVYNEDRRNYLTKLFEKNKNKTTQTRATYAISVAKSVRLCKLYNKKYYLWTCK